MGFAVFIAAKYIREPPLIRRIFALLAMVSRSYSSHGFLLRAIAISLLLHAVLLLQPGVEQVTPSNAVMTMLDARLKHAAAAISDSSPSDKRAEKPVWHPPLYRIEAPTSSVDVVRGVTSMEQAHDATDAAIVPHGENDATGIMSHTAPITDAIDSAPDFAEQKKSYMFALAAEARKVKQYPRRAFAEGWTGTAEIGISIAAGGNVQAPLLRKTSGYADLDNAALAFVGIALKRTSVPESLRQRAFEFVLPVTFSVGSE